MNINNIREEIEKQMKNGRLKTIVDALMMAAESGNVVAIKEIIDLLKEKEKKDNIFDI